MKEVNSLYTKHYKILLKEIEDKGNRKKFHVYCL